MRSRLALVLAGFVAATFTTVAAAAPPAPPPAPAPGKNQCFDAYEQGQRLRKALKLRQSREQFALCSDAACPDFVKQDCTKWLGELDSAIPTVVVVARDKDGKQFESVHVTMDGQPLTDHADGRPIAVDPGPHDLRYEAGGQTLDDHVVVAEGSKDQQLIADFSKLAPAPPPSPTASRIPLLTWVLGGVAVVGTASFVTFAVLGRSTQSCAPDCTSTQVSTLRRDYLVADVSWIVALAAAGGALYFALRTPSAPAQPQAAWTLTLRPNAGGASVGAETGF